MAILPVINRLLQLLQLPFYCRLYCRHHTHPTKIKDKGKDKDKEMIKNIEKLRNQDIDQTDCICNSCVVLRTCSDIKTSFSLFGTSPSTIMRLGVNIHWVSGFPLAYDTC